MRLVRIPTAAKQFGISKQYLWSLVSSKKIAFTEIDGVHYIDMDTTTYGAKHDYKAGGRKKWKNV